MMKTVCQSEQLRDTIIEEALSMLVEKPVKATTLERIRLFDEAHNLVREEPQPLQMGKGLSYVLERISLPLEPYDLILGRVSESVPTEQEEAYLQELFRRFGRGEGQRESRPPWIYDGGHISFYWKDLIRLGLSGLRARAEAELERRRAAGASQEVLDWLEGAVLCYQALQNYLLRYAAQAEAAGMEEAAQACRAGGTREPRTFREALQMLWAVQLVYCSLVASNPTLTYGRMDQLLYPLYQRDLAEGRLTREEAGLLILDFYCKNNLNMGRGEHQLGLEDESLSTGWLRNLNFDAPQYLVLGGCDGGRPASNDLTLLFLQQVQPRFKNPVIVLRYTQGMARQYPELWRAVAGLMRESASLMIYNDGDVIDAFLRAGVEYEDAVQAEHYGCNWPCLPGMESSGNCALEQWGKQVDPDFLQGPPAYWRQYSLSGGMCGQLLEIIREAPGEEAPGSIDYFYDRFLEKYRVSLREQIGHIRRAREQYYREAPGILQLKDLFFRDSIAKACSYLCGSAKYFVSNITHRGFATLVDCFTVVDQLVCRERKLTLPQLREALEHNFEGYPRIHGMCREVPKLGSDSELSNYHGRRILTLLTDAVSEVQREHAEQGHDPIVLYNCIETDTSHIAMGKHLGATPDGRTAGMPVSQNSQPSVGASINGMTARLRAMAQLPFDRIASGAQNLTIQPRLFQGEKGLALLGAAISTYFELGGLQLQVSAVDVSELLDAQIHPERHKDLMVRITDYSAVFVDMTKAAQDDLIRREATAL